MICLHQVDPSPMGFLCKAQLTLELLQCHRAVTARVQLAENVADPIHACAAAAIAATGISPRSWWDGALKNGAWDEAPKIVFQSCQT